VRHAEKSLEKRPKTAQEGDFGDYCKTVSRETV
jgi:hypothetical protein